MNFHFCSDTFQSHIFNYLYSPRGFVIAQKLKVVLEEISDIKAILCEVKMNKKKPLDDIITSLKTEEYKKQGWKNSPCSSFIKISKAELSFIHLSNNDCCDEISADYKKDINAYKASTKRFKPSMEQDNWNNCKGS